jgi:hypothetical protein
MTSGRMDLSGIFYCDFRPDVESRGGWTNNDTIFIYPDESQRLSFNFLLEKESNHGRICTFEEGFVHQDAAGRDAHLEVRWRYSWTSWGTGYEAPEYQSFAFPSQHTIRILRMLDQAETARAREEGKFFEHAKMALFEPEQDVIFRRVDGGEGDQCRSADRLERTIVQTRLELHNHWQDWIEKSVRFMLAHGMRPEEIAERCDWTVESIRALSQD